MDIDQQIAQLEQLIGEISVLDETEQAIAKKNYTQQLSQLRQKRRAAAPTSGSRPLAHKNKKKKENRGLHLNWEPPSNTLGESEQPKLEINNCFQFEHFGQSEMESALERCKLDIATIRVALSYDKLCSGRMESVLSETQKQYQFTALKFPRDTELPQVIDVKTPGLYSINTWFYERVTNLLLMKDKKFVNTSNMRLSEALQLLEDQDSILCVQPDLYFGAIKMSEGVAFRFKIPGYNPAITETLKSITNIVDLPFNLRCLRCDEEEMGLSSGMMIFDRKEVQIHLINEDEISVEKAGERFGVGPLFLKLRIPYGSTKGTGEWWRAQVSQDMRQWLAHPEKYVKERMGYLFPGGSSRQYKENLTLDKSKFQTIEEGTCTVDISYDLDSKSS